MRASHGGRRVRAAARQARRYRLHHRGRELELTAAELVSYVRRLRIERDLGLEGRIA
jgi:hypothetical protein